MSFNQLSVHTLLLLLFISITVTLWGNQQEQDPTVLGQGWGLKCSLFAHGGRGADNPKVQWDPMALTLLGSLSQNLESLSHTSQDFPRWCIEKKIPFGCWSLCFFLLYNFLPGATGFQSQSQLHTWVVSHLSEPVELSGVIVCISIGFYLIIPLSTSVKVQKFPQCRSRSYHYIII